LGVGIKKVWENTDQLTQEQKSLIKDAVPTSKDRDYPAEENELNTLQLALVAVNMFNGLKLQTWLDEHASKLPDAFRCFVHEIGFYFHQSEKPLPFSFATALCNYLKQTKSHVATLNYDNLLYDAMLSNKVLHQYDHLIDGYLKDGFASENLDAKNKSLGWYLHLHGSPLFVGNEKKTREQRANRKASEQVHIVLTHADRKRDVINDSHILKEYWRRLEMALNQCEFVCVFGCSGHDVHLNEVIRSHIGPKPIQVIEWNGDGESDQSRAEFWNGQLGKVVKLKRMTNILEFKDWGKLA
jgi:hypothetical protein